MLHANPALVRNVSLQLTTSLFSGPAHCGAVVYDPSYVAVAQLPSPCRLPVDGRGLRVKKEKRKGGPRPELEPGMSVKAFADYYWLKDELIDFVKVLRLPTDGYKPDLSARIERRLRKMPDRPPTQPRRSKGPRDSDRSLSQDTPVVNYYSDAKTREFFKSQIGPEFHFTYHVNQFRLANEGLTYGDLVDEWMAEKDRRRSEGYEAPLAVHGKYNRFIRAYFADPENKGKSLRDAALAWNEVKKGRGDHCYEPGKK